MRATGTCPECEFELEATEPERGETLICGECRVALDVEDVAAGAMRLTTAEAGLDGAILAPQSSNRSASSPEPADFLREAFSRNVDIIAPKEQATLDGLRVLVAGCGSVGGAVVEPLARMGVRSFVLADPDVYELSNLNRQACYLPDVGRPKAAVLAERVTAINPYAKATALTEGITVDNHARALDGVNVVFDGMDSPWEKYLLHAEAARRRIPIIAGADFGGKPVLYVFDYRRDQRPFYGQTRSEDHRDGRFLESVRWLGYRPIPSDFLPIVADRIATGDPWPQIAYCVSGMGALGSRTVLDVALGRPVRHIVALDVHQAPRKPAARLMEHLRWPATAMRTVAGLRRGVARRSPPAALPELPAALREVLEAGRRAPSPHNTQPWRFTVKGPHNIHLDWDRSRILSAADPDGHGVTYALGCAIQAMAAVAEVTFEPIGGGSLLDPRWYAGNIRIERLRTRFAEADPVVRYRGTTRTPYPEDRIAGDALTSLVREAGRFGTALHVVQSTDDVSRLADLTREAAVEQFADDSILSELLDWIRLQRDEEHASPDGFTPTTLALDPATARLMRLLRSSPLVRAGASRAGVVHAMAGQSAAAVERSGALLLLARPVSTVVDRIAGGRAMMAVWLEATRLGLAVQPVSSAVGPESTRAATVDLFGASREDEVVTLLRVGRATGAPPPSPRLPLERLCTLDRAAWSAATT
jgi:nitroreductase